MCVLTITNAFRPCRELRRIKERGAPPRRLPRLEMKPETPDAGHP
jgi:hypothetical protein